MVSHHGNRNGGGGGCFTPEDNLNPHRIHHNNPVSKQSFIFSSKFENRPRSSPESSRKWRMTAGKRDNKAANPMFADAQLAVVQID